MRRIAGSNSSSAARCGVSLLLLAAIASAWMLLIPAASATAQTVTVVLAGGGSGTVVSDPAGISCSNTGNPGGAGIGTCSTTSFPNNNGVQLTVTADSHYLFQKWDGGANAGTCQVGAKNPCEFTPSTPAGPVTINVYFQPPPPPPIEVTTLGSSGIGADLVTLEGSVNPNSAVWPLNDCRFEYGETEQYNKSVPCEQTQVGPSTSAVAVRAQVNLLTPSTTYHFRLAASNASGTGHGDDQALATAAGGIELCANAAVRRQQGTTFLPECRAYEKVSADFKHGEDAKIFDSGSFAPLSPDGDAIVWTAPQYGPFLALRQAGGWASSSIHAPYDLLPAGGEFGGAAFFTGDLSSEVNCGTAAPGTGIDTFTRNPRYPAVCLLRKGDGTWALVPTVPTVAGLSADLSHIVFGQEGGLYEVVDPIGSGASVRRVDVDGSGIPLGSGGAVLGGAGSVYQAVSADGSTIYFTATPLGGTPTIYARVGGSATVAISTPFSAECGGCDPTPKDPSFRGASSDGRRVFFTTAQPLVSADTDATTDLYEYDLGNPGHHVQVSGGGPGDLTPGAGAEVQGVVQISEDGSHTYFIAKGVLTTAPNSAGKSATAGASNLYIVERDAAFPSGRTRFVATVPSGEVASLTNSSKTPAQATPDGRYLVFQTTEKLITNGPEADTDATMDVYRYDAQSGELNRVSVGEPSWPASNNGNTPGVSAELQGGLQPSSLAESEAATRAVISDDGSKVVFVTPEKLQSEDINGNPASTSCASGAFGCDVYLWHDDSVSLISDAEPGKIRVNAVNGSISASGTDVFFASLGQLVPQDTDSNFDLYDARVGGGFAFSAPPSACSGNEGCHGASGAEPAPAAEATASFSGPGNEAAPAPRKHRRHKKKHHRRKSKQGQHRRAHRRG